MNFNDTAMGAVHQDSGNPSRRLKTTNIKMINSVEFNFLNKMKMYRLKEIYVYPKNKINILSDR